MVKKTIKRETSIQIDKLTNSIEGEVGAVEGEEVGVAEGQGKEVARVDRCES